MSRVVPKALRMLLDLVALATMYVLAFLLRFDWHIPADMMHRCIFVLPYALALKYAVLYAFDVPKFAWRYIGLREVLQILKALSVVSALLLLVRLIAPPLSKSLPIFREAVVPMGSLAMDLVLAFCAIVGLRSGWRLIVERQGKLRHATPREAATPKRTLLVGAGDAGLLVVKEAAARPDLGIEPVGFVDDDATKVGTIVHGVPVVGRTEELVAICEKLRAEQVLVTIADAPGVAIRKLMSLCEKANIPVKIIPQMHEIVDGRVNLSRLRDVAIEDLLRRDTAKLDESAIAGNIGGKVILVTGAGGSIGSELCRQLARVQPKKLLLVEQAENALFEIHRELVASYPKLEIVPLIGDITDRARMLAIFRAHEPKVVLHAAAHKHVPMMEWNPGEAVKNNVFGTKTVADVARECGAERFVMISTDKAVNPTSVMGATKRVAELYIQSISREASGGTRYVAVRFGNVLGSAGSVIPVFREQIARGGPVTVTHPEMRRYFMTIPEASQLVVQAATMGKGGEIFILDMGEPVLVRDLAEDLIRLSGLRPGEDIEIKITGMRPGEKLFEELSVADEAAEKTYHPKIFVGRLATQTETLATKFRSLEAALEGNSGSEIRSLLKSIVPEYLPEQLDHAPPSPRAERRDDVDDNAPEENDRPSLTVRVSTDQVGLST